MIVTVMKMTEKKIKLIALDLDDTTLRSDASLAPETAQTIANAVKSGTQVVIASGRAFKSLPQSVLQIDGIRYAICSNGACIEDMHSRTRLFSFTLGPQVVERLLETFSGERFEAFVDGQPYCDGEYYREPLRFGCSPAYVDYVKTTRIPVDDMPGFMRRHIAELDSVDIMCGTLEHKAELWEKTKRLSDVYVTSSSPRLIEISADTTTVTKKGGVKMTERERRELIAQLEDKMKKAAKMLEYEIAAELRDEIIRLRGEK